jgi:hypothetical protein
MSKAHLIPTAVVDKNGKPTTVHKKLNASGSGKASSVPAPSLVSKAAAKKPARKKPLSKQLEVKHRMTDFSSYRPDQAIYAALGVNIEHEFPLAIIQASDVQMYDMFAILETDNAFALLSQGVTDADAAVELLESNGLGHLLVDRRDMADDALDRRVGAWTFLELASRLGIGKGCDPKTYVDAARLEDSTTLPRWTTNGEPSSYAYGVACGDIDYDDVMSIGITELSKSDGSSQLIYDRLKDIKAGTAGYDVELLKHLHSKSLTTRDMDSGFRLAEEHGAEFVTGVRDLSHVLSLDSDFKDRNVEDRRSLLSYAIEGGLAFHYLSNKEIARLHDESVPIDFAIERVKEQGVDRLVEIHKSGINKAVSSGWL